MIGSLINNSVPLHYSRSKFQIQIQYLFEIGFKNKRRLAMGYFTDLILSNHTNNMLSFDNNSILHDQLCHTCTTGVMYLCVLHG